MTKCQNLTNWQTVFDKMSKCVVRTPHACRQAHPLWCAHAPLCCVASTQFQALAVGATGADGRRSTHHPTGGTDHAPLRLFFDPRRCAQDVRPLRLHPTRRYEARKAQSSNVGRVRNALLLRCLLKRSAVNVSDWCAMMQLHNCASVSDAQHGEVRTCASSAAASSIRAVSDSVRQRMEHTHDGRCKCAVAV